ncbi:DNA-directed RNA polymerase subunit beta' [Ruminococcus sp.]|uniref:DNA-directed RNA polymerase subunit beta' n=1 Tax=Ruminococcus sp. TaxID=41978 RepID=UPI003AB0C43B
MSIGLASPEEILENSSGEVLKPETINYRTYKPERDGLFCERIFGPIKDYECHCGKYKRIRYKGIVCDRCGVEVTEKKVRRERMGHIQLVVPVAHIWYFRSLPNKIGYLLGLPTKKLDSIIYYERYVVIQPGVKAEDGVAEYDLLSEEEYLDILDTLPKDNQYLEDNDPNKFVAKMGAEAIYDLLARLDLDALSYELRHRAGNDASQQRKNEALKRLQVVESFRASRGRNKPEWMIVRIVPVIPPELRPLVPLDGGRFATSDLNDLYRRVIIRNNRLKRLIEIKAPEVILRNEKRMLQESVDSLFDNSRKSSAVKTDANRPLKSLSDSLKGKQGRFRQNLLGKRVDYSARSVIVVGPELRMGECGIPKLMAAELYKPFIIRKLIERGIVKTVKSAKKIVDRKEPVIWDILEHVMKGHPVLLNRAPTLHRLGIQAFQPKMIEGKAIQLHPLACTAFNADFDGDQMAVHVPLSAEAQAEARFLMLAAGNLLKPSDGQPVTVPTQDMILGSYYLTLDKDGERGEGKVFRDVDEAMMAYQTGVIQLHSKIKVRYEKVIDGVKYSDLVDTTIGKIIFNNPIPQNLGFVDRSKPENRFKLEVDFLVGKSKLKKIIDKCIKINGTEITSHVLDHIKAQGYKYSTRGAITVAVCDAVIPPAKKEIIKKAESDVDAVREDYMMGLRSDEERYEEVLKIWEKATNDVTDALQKNLDRYNPIFMMADSGARGSMSQIRQLAGMRGLIANTSGKTIEIPIKANYREGLNIMEYFISSRGARKGLTDTALRTADSGYLTRRLVDVSQEVIIREDDCGTTDGLEIFDIKAGENNVIEGLHERLIGRYLVDDFCDSNGNTLVSKDVMMGDKEADIIVNSGVERIKIRSVLSCRAKHGACKKCYGSNLANRQPVTVGEAVGIIAAQSIGEPGTQLTMRTFHTGGVASAEDITQGLPRVEELFEARKPKSLAIISEIDGEVRFEEIKNARHAIVFNHETGEEKQYLIPFGFRVKVQEGQIIKKGDKITDGAVNPHDILAILGSDAVMNYLISEVQSTYRLQGVEINDKHIEVIVRQMMRKVRVEDAGDTKFMSGQTYDKNDVLFENEQIKKRIANGEENLREATFTQLLLGITKAALATDSFLSAASFQETTRVLTDAAIKGKIDPLIGLKENVIIGKVIPAGTGMPRYAGVKLEEPKSEVEDADENAVESTETADISE